MLAQRVRRALLVNDRDSFPGSEVWKVTADSLTYLYALHRGVFEVSDFLPEMPLGINDVQVAIVGKMVLDGVETDSKITVVATDPTADARIRSLLGQSFQFRALTVEFVLDETHRITVDFVVGSGASLALRGSTGVSTTQTRSDTYAVVRPLLARAAEHGSGRLWQKISAFQETTVDFNDLAEDGE